MATVYLLASFARICGARLAYFDQPWLERGDAETLIRFVRESNQVQGKIQGPGIAIVESQREGSQYETT